MRRASVEFSGGSARSAVFEYFHELAAGAEQKDRPELRIEAGADNQLRRRPLSLTMGCTVTPWKCCAPTLSVTEVWMARKARSTASALPRFQLHAATSVLWVMVSE